MSLEVPIEHGPLVAEKSETSTQTEPTAVVKKRSKKVAPKGKGKSKSKAKPKKKTTKKAVKKR